MQQADCQVASFASPFGPPTTRHSSTQHYTLTTQFITSSTHEHPRATDTLWDPVPPSILMQSARASNQLHLQTILCILNYLYCSRQYDLHRQTEISKVSTGVLCGLPNDAVKERECTRPWELFVHNLSYYLLYSRIGRLRKTEGTSTRIEPPKFHKFLYSVTVTAS